MTQNCIFFNQLYKVKNGESVWCGFGGCKLPTEVDGVTYATTNVLGLETLWG